MHTVAPGSGAVMRAVKRLPPPRRGDGGFTNMQTGALAALV